jgi:hypothetical protein
MLVTLAYFEHLIHNKLCSSWMQLCTVNTKLCGRFFYSNYRVENVLSDVWNKGPSSGELVYGLWLKRWDVNLFRLSSCGEIVHHVCSRCCSKIQTATMQFKYLCLHSSRSKFVPAWIWQGLQINIWLDRTFVRSLLILVGHNLNLDIIRHKIYISHETSMYSHSGAMLSKMLECLIAKCKLSEFAILSDFVTAKKCMWLFFLWSDQCPIKIIFARTFVKFSRTLSDVRQ